MRKLLLAAVALASFSALAASGAVAAPRGPHDHRAPERPMMTQAEQRPMNDPARRTADGDPS